MSPLAVVEFEVANKVRAEEQLVSTCRVRILYVQTVMLGFTLKPHKRFVESADSFADFHVSLIVLGSPDANVAAGGSWPADANVAAGARAPRHPDARDGSRDTLSFKHPSQLVSTLLVTVDQIRLVSPPPPRVVQDA